MVSRVSEFFDLRPIASSFLVGSFTAYELESGICLLRGSKVIPYYVQSLIGHTEVVLIFYGIIISWLHSERGPAVFVGTAL